MSSYTVKTPHGDVTVVYWWGNDPWQKFPPCPDCGDCCGLQVGENDLCAGAYEGICHKVWVATYGTTPWDDDGREWERMSTFRYLLTFRWWLYSAFMLGAGTMVTLLWLVGALAG